MLDWFFLAYIAIGTVAGLFAGLLGIGGGSVFGPFLLIVFSLQGIPPAEAALAAVSTSIAAVLFTSLPSAAVHSMHGTVKWKVFLPLAPAAALGAMAGAQVAQQVPSFLLVLAMLVLLGNSVRQMLLRSDLEQVVDGFSKAKLMAVGTCAGGIGAMTGTGGGVLVAPWLVKSGFGFKEAVGTSAAMTMLVAVGSTLSYGGTGLDVPALVGMALACVLSAAAGARLTKILPAQTVRRIYCVFLAFICLRLVYWLGERVIEL